MRYFHGSAISTRGHLLLVDEDWESDNLHTVISRKFGLEVLQEHFIIREKGTCRGLELTGGSIPHWQGTIKADLTLSRFSILQHATSRYDTGAYTSQLITHFSFFSGDRASRVQPCDTLRDQHLYLYAQLAS